MEDHKDSGPWFYDDAVMQANIRTMSQEYIMENSEVQMNKRGDNLLFLLLQNF